MHAGFDVGRHQIGRALDALVVKPEDRAQSLDEAGLGETGDADQQRGSAPQQGDQSLLDHLALAKDDFSDTLTDKAEASAPRFDLGNQSGGGGVGGGSGRRANRSPFTLS